MAIDFPASPGVNDSHTVGTTTFVWNGTYWGRSANTAKFTAADAAPSNPALGDLWYESDSGKAFIYYDSTWVELGHASDGQSFKIQDGVPAGVTGDIWYESDSGKTFIYYDSVWVEIGFATSGQDFHVGDTLPASPTQGDIWFESDSGASFIYYTDADSSQWVEVGHASDGRGFNTGDTAPVGPSEGDIWYETDTGAAFIYYTDADSSQWVEIGHASDVSDFGVYNIDGGLSNSVYGGLTTIDCGLSA